MEEQNNFEDEDKTVDELLQLLAEIKKNEPDLEPLEVYFEKIKSQTYKSESFNARFKKGYHVLLEGINQQE